MNDISLEKEDISFLNKNKKFSGSFSKRSGKYGERKCVLFLKEVTNLPWERVPNSGAFIGGRNRQRVLSLSSQQVFLFLGDIINPEGLKYHFLIECKNYNSKNFSLKKLQTKNKNSISEGNAKLKKFTDELIYDYITSLNREINKITIPMLYINLKRNLELIAVNSDLLNYIFPENSINKSDLLFEYLHDYSHLITTIPEEKKNFFKLGKKWEIYNFKKFILNNKNLLFEKEIK